MAKYSELKEKTCEVCGRTIRGRKVCPSCCAKRNGWKQSTVTFKGPLKWKAQEVFNAGLKALEKELALTETDIPAKANN